MEQYSYHEETGKITLEKKAVQIVKTQEKAFIS